MSTIHFTEKTTATPEQFVAGLTDFGPGRSELFENSADDDLTVHDKGATEADVTEGSSGVWERLHYDWSDPTTSSSPPPTPTPGEATRAIPTPSSRSRTGRPKWTTSWCARART